MPEGVWLSTFLSACFPECLYIFLSQNESSLKFINQFGFQGLNGMLELVAVSLCTCIFVVIIFFVFSFCLIIFGCNRDLSENEDTIDIEHLEVAGQPSNICLVT